MQLTIKDIMSKRIISVPPDMNAAEALKVLLDSAASGLPVIDKNGCVVGVFTEKEILRAVLPIYLKDVGSFAYTADSKSQLKKLAHLGDLLVADIMRKEVSTAGEEASLTEISHIMLTKSERRVIITRGCKAVGIITRCDVVKALAKEAGLAV